MNFPKFNELYTISILQPERISNEMRLTFSLLSEQHLQNIYLLILHYAVLEQYHQTQNLQESIKMFYPTNYKKINLPYKGSSNGKGVIYDLDQLPIQLEYIIAAYLKQVIIK